MNIETQILIYYEKKMTFAVSEFDSEGEIRYTNHQGIHI